MALTPEAGPDGHDGEDVLRTLLDQSIAGIYILDRSGTIRYINARFAELCGSSPPQMIGRTFFDFVAEEELAERRASFARLAAGDIPSLQTTGTFKARSGEPIELLTQSTLARYGGETAIIGVVADVTQRRSIERELERAKHVARILGAANSALVRANDEGELLQEMCNVALASGAYSMAWVGFAEHDSEKHVRPVARAGTGTDVLDQFPARWDDSERAQGPAGTAIRTKSLALIRANDRQLNSWQQFMTAYHQHGSLIGLPLIDAAGTVFGALTLASEDAHAFGSDEVELLVQLASDIAYGITALRNRKALRSAEERQRAHTARLEALWKIVNNPRLSGDELTAAMLAGAATAIRPGLPYMGALMRIAGDEVIVEAVAETPEYARTGRGAGDIQPGLRIGVAGSAVERALELGSGTHTWDDLAAAFDTPRVQQFQWRSTIATTFDSGRTTYLLWFASTSDTGGWEEQDRAYVEIVASFFSSHAQMRWQSDQLQYHQTHDVLTGVLNRSQFRSRARIASVDSTSYAVITLNVSGFGEVNEAYGNMIGDALLVEVAAGLSERTLPGEIVGRLGGDVFAVFVPTPRSVDFVRERAVHFAERFRHPFSTGDREGKEFIALAASFGMAVAPHHATTLDTLISHASVAVATAKARGRGTMLFYEPGMEGDAERNITFRNELADALGGDQFELYFQPHVNILTGEKTGCEALIRWHHPQRGLVPPGQFIPAAERSGLISGIDAWVLRAALLKARDFKLLRSDFRLYFNLSGRQAGDPKLIDALKAAAADGVPLENIGIEITETDAMRDFEATREVCLAARDLGVRVAIDDFGTGYSSLSSLKRLPVDVVKIDRSFISGILTDRHDEAIVNTIIAMTRLFECDVLAEGVEQEGEMDWAPTRLYVRPRIFRLTAASARCLHRLDDGCPGAIGSSPISRG